MKGIYGYGDGDEGDGDEGDGDEGDGDEGDGYEGDRNRDNLFEGSWHTLLPAEKNNFTRVKSCKQCRCRYDIYRVSFFNWDPPKILKYGKQVSQLGPP